MRQLLVISTAAAVLAGFAPPAAAQLPLAPRAATGQTVTPAFEGWYRNLDGTFSLSFGYYNRNTDEVLDIPIGPDNFIAPGSANQGQPEHFQPRRHWGVFAIQVPADFGQRKVTWTLKVQGETFAIPGSLHPDWQIDALQGEAGSGNTPPVLMFSSGGVIARGPGGAVSGPMSAKVGQPLDIRINATDDGRSSGSVASVGRADVPVSLTWYKHQGPGAVAFSPATPRPSANDGMALTQATFSKPGTYLLRVRANDASGISGAGHAQCCWTNGFVRVVVTP